MTGPTADGFAWCARRAAEREAAYPTALAAFRAGRLVLEWLARPGRCRIWDGSECGGPEGTAARVAGWLRAGLSLGIEVVDRPGR